MEFITLIVDDNVEYRGVFQALIHGEFPSMSVISVGSSAEVWQCLAKHQPDIVFSDINLQTDDGLVLISQIREKFLDVFIAVMTSDDGPEYRTAAYNSGADCFVPKNAVSLYDIICLVKSVQSHQLPDWSLGPAYLNPKRFSQRWR